SSWIDDHWARHKKRHEDDEFPSDIKKTQLDAIKVPTFLEREVLARIAHAALLPLSLIKSVAKTALGATIGVFSIITFNKCNIVDQSRVRLKNFSSIISASTYFHILK